MASTISLQALQPRVKEIQERYKGRPQEEMQVEVARLYKEVRGDLGSFSFFSRFFHVFFSFLSKDKREEEEKSSLSTLSPFALPKTNPGRRQPARRVPPDARDPASLDRALPRPLQRRRRRPALGRVVLDPEPRGPDVGRRAKGRGGVGLALPLRRRRAARRVGRGDQVPHPARAADGVAVCEPEDHEPAVGERRFRTFFFSFFELLCFFLFRRGRKGKKPHFFPRNF